MQGHPARRQVIWAAEGIGGRVKFLPLAWAGMPKTRFRKNSELEIQPIIATLLKFSAKVIENSTFFLGDHLTLLPSYRVVPENILTDQIGLFRHILT